MPAAILFRGHAHRTIGQGRGWGIDWRKCVESHRTHLIEPLKARYDELHVYVCTYDTPLINEIRSDYRPEGLAYAKPGDTQRGTFLVGLGEIAEAQYALGNYDLVTTCRFDLELLKCPLDHGTFRPDCVNFLWREWSKENWDHHNRVPDAIHLLPGELLDAFRRGAADQPSVNCMHLVYRPVARETGGRVHVMDESDFTNSNSDVQPNPVYKMIRVLE